MKIGFTGTREGMSEAQLDQLGMLLQAFERATARQATPTDEMRCSYCG